MTTCRLRWANLVTFAPLAIRGGRSHQSFDGMRSAVSLLYMICYASTRLGQTTQSKYKQIKCLSREQKSFCSVPVCSEACFPIMHFILLQGGSPGCSMYQLLSQILESFVWQLLVENLLSYWTFTQQQSNDPLEHSLSV